MLPVVNFYYKNAEDSNCIPELDKFFNGLGENEYVVANFSNVEGECGVNMEKMTNISNHLSSSKCWSSIQDWHVDVEYTICLLYTSPSPRDGLLSRMPSSA